MPQAESNRSAMKKGRESGMIIICQTVSKLWLPVEISPFQETKDKRWSWNREREAFVSIRKKLAKARNWALRGELQSFSFSLDFTGNSRFRNWALLLNTCQKGF